MSRTKSWLKLGCFIVVLSVLFSTNAIAQFDRDKMSRRLHRDEVLKEYVVRNVGLNAGYKYWVESGYVLNGDFSSDIFSRIGTFLPAFDQYPDVRIGLYKTLVDSVGDSLNLYSYTWKMLETKERIFESDIPPSWSWRKDLKDIQLFERGVIGVYTKDSRVVFIGGTAADNGVAASFIRNAKSEDERIQLLKYKFQNYLVRDVEITRSDSEIVGHFYSNLKQKNIEFKLEKYRTTISEPLKADPDDAINRLQNQLREPRIGSPDLSAEAITQSIGRNRALYAWSMLVERNLCKAELDFPINKYEIVKYIPAYLQSFDLKIKKIDDVKPMKNMIAYSFAGCPQGLWSLTPKIFPGEEARSSLTFWLNDDTWIKDCHGGYCYVDTTTGKIRNHSGHWKAGMKGCPSRAARIAVKKRTPCLRAVER